MALATDEAQMIGEHIKDARKSAGLTQAHLAEAIGVSQAQIAHYESGRKWPNIQMLIKMCKVLGTSSDKILGI